MNPIIIKALKGAAGGFVTAFVIDINAWQKSPGLSFDWMLALKRWACGAITGAMTAVGLA